MVNCTLRYYQSGNQCLNCPTGCFSCVNSSMCLACDTNYLLDYATYTCSFQATTTPNCSSKCLICLNQTSCIQCESGYFVNSSSLCSSCVNGCSQCSNSSNCLDTNKTAPAPAPDQGTSCLVSQYIDGNGTCRPCHVYCYKCSSWTNCTQCLMGSTLRSDNICHKSCTGSTFSNPTTF